MADKFEVQCRDYQRAAAALKDADKTIRLEFSRTIRQIAKPYAQRVLAQGAADLPHRGGLSARVAAAKVTVSATSMRAVMVLRTAEGYDLKAMDKGTIRHPVFTPKGEKGPWVGQKIEPGAFSRPFEADAPMVRAKMVEAGHASFRKIAQ